MTDLLSHVSREFDSRMALRRRMLKHLGVSLSEESTIKYREDIRATLIGCTNCQSQDVCEQWLNSGRAGVPVTCWATDAFMRLQAVSEAERLPKPAKTQGYRYAS